MSQLNERDLAILSTIVYSDFLLHENNAGASLGELALEMRNHLSEPGSFPSGADGFSGDFQHLYNNSGGDAARDAVIEVLNAIIESDDLSSLTIQYPELRGRGYCGISAATFVGADNTATVVFRGTDGSYKQWFDNFEGAGIEFRGTPQQEAALRYTEMIAASELGLTDVTVTGHSKGGNMAMFVAIFCENVARSVSFSGQGFSENFINSWREQIESRRDRITSIVGHNDFVGILMFCIAGERFFIYNDMRNGVGWQEGHYMSNLIRAFDEYGNFTPWEQCPLWQTVEVFLDELMLFLPPLTEEVLIDIIGAIAALALGGAERGWDDVLHAIVNIIVGIAVLPLAAVVDAAIIIASVIVTAIYAVVVAIEWTVEQITNAILAVVDIIAEIAAQVGEWMVELANSIREAVENFRQWARDFRDRRGIRYADENPHIKVDTELLRNYAQAIQTVNDRLSALDSDVRWLWTDTRLIDLFSRVAVNLMLRESHTLDKVRDYLNNAADNFEAAENKAYGIMGGNI